MPELFKRLFVSRLTLSLALSLALSGAARAQTPLVAVAGKSAGDRLGHAVAAVGDVDADGRVDWVLGSPYSDLSGSLSGSAVVVSGATGFELFEVSGDTPHDLFGYAVTGGDLNGDGVGDFVVGAYADDPGGVDSGAVFAYSGVDGRPLWTRVGGRAGDNLGFSLAWVPDTDGDGRGEILAGAWGADGRSAINRGEALLLDGDDGALLQVWGGEAAYDFFGAAVTGVEDLDGDGAGDVVVGAIGNDMNGNGAGSAHVFSGATGASLFTLRGDVAGDAFGTALAAAGDVDGDGTTDFLVGAPGSDRGAANCGLARLFSGVSGLPLQSWNGSNAGDNLGMALAGGFDVTMDGTPDLFLGVPAADQGGTSSGQVRVQSGADGSLFTTLDGPAAGARFGAALASAGDQNGSGYEDLLVGAWGENPGAGSFAGAAHAIAFTEPVTHVSNYCAATPNSLGATALISSFGTTSVASNIFTLACDGALPATPGLFFYGPNEQQIPFGDGFLCVDGGVFRLPATTTDAFGHAEAALDVTDPPAEGGAIFPGSTWKFQYWYRDVNSETAAFNLSDGLSVDFLP